MNNLFKHLLIVGACLLPTAALAMPQVYPTGTTIYKPEKAYNGFTLIAGGTPRMIDMNGNLVNEWSASGVNGFPAKPLPGGSILTTGPRWKGLIDDGITLVQLDWNGKTEWEFRNFLEVPNDGSAPADQKNMMISTQHHDMQRRSSPVYHVPGVDMPKSGNMLILGHEWHVNPAINDNLLMDDVVFEVDESGKVLWKWRAADHVEEFGFSKEARQSMKNWKPLSDADREKGFDWWHQNCVSFLGPNKWYDAGDKRFHPDNIIFDSRESNILLIVEPKSGKVVWKAGPDYAKGDDAKIGQIVGPHNTHMIPKGLPGEGNILVYDNGGQAGYGTPTALDPTGRMVVQRGYTRVLEFNPVTKKIVWQYSIKSHKKPWTMFGYWDYSPFISSAQRLPNGNTLICEGSNGRFIEVTVEGEIVWEYISPYPGNIPGTNYVYRAYRLPYEWAPEAVRTAEVAVVPPANGDMQLPNAEGVLPSVHTVLKKGDTPAAAGSSSGIVVRRGSAPQEATLYDDEEDFEEESANTMHAY